MGPKQTSVVRNRTKTIIRKLSAEKPAVFPITACPKVFLVSCSHFPTSLVFIEDSPGQPQDSKLLQGPPRFGGATLQAATAL